MRNRCGKRRKVRGADPGAPPLRRLARIMTDDALHSPETAALFARADRAVQESRRLTALLRGWQDQALVRFGRMFEIGADLGRPRRILSASDAADPRGADPSLTDAVTFRECDIEHQLHPVVEAGD